jgi:predicted outer membrane protein
MATAEMPERGEMGSGLQREGREATMNIRFLIPATALLLSANSPPPEAVNDFGSEKPMVPLLADQVLTSTIHVTNLMEIRAGKLAQERGLSVLVRSLGDRLARDHRMIDRMLVRAADQAGVPIPAAELRDAGMVAPLEREFGRSFDVAYVNMMIEGHLHDIAALTAAFDREPAGPLRDFLGKVLPVLKQHLQVAENIRPWI